MRAIEYYTRRYTQTHTHTHTHKREPCGDEQLHELPYNSIDKSWCFLFCKPFFGGFVICGGAYLRRSLCMGINESQQKRRKTSCIFSIKTYVYLQRYIPNPLKHLRWRLFKKQLPKTPLNVWQDSEYGYVLQKHFVFLQKYLFFF